MNKTATAQQTQTTDHFSHAKGQVMLQRKCACGNHTIAGDECADCAQKKMGLQRKLTIGASNDPMEQEADRIADQVMATPGHGLIRSAPVKIQRFTGNPSGQTAEVPASVERVLASPGRPLEPALRQDMEGRFGYDFSQVRVHTGGAAEQSAEDVNASAYTVENNVVFGAGQFVPGTHEGRRLIAHELTHVMQQKNVIYPFQNLRNLRPGSVLPKQQAENFSVPITQQEYLPNFQIAQFSVTPILFRQAAERLRPLSPSSTPPVRQPPPLRVIEGGLARATARSSQRTGWRYFWRAVIRRFGFRIAIAAALAAADGPLPIGELIDIGLALWTIWDIVQLWDVIWSEANQIQQQEEGSMQPQAQTRVDERQRRRENCFSNNPGAIPCDEPVFDGDDIRDEVVVEFLYSNGYGFDSLVNCSQVGSPIGLGEIEDCGKAPAIRYHCQVRNTPNIVSIFACLCCDINGDSHFQWSRPHWSINQSRRGN
jgi:hypothetical protein